MSDSEDFFKRNKNDNDKNSILARDPKKNEVPIFLPTSSMSAMLSYKNILYAASDENFILYSIHNSLVIEKIFSERDQMQIDHLSYQERKKIKPDFESLSYLIINKKEYFHLLPSFSKKNRKTVYLLECENEFESKKFNLNFIFKNKSSLGDTNFNHFHLPQNDSAEINVELSLALNLENNLPVKHELNLEINLELNIEGHFFKDDRLFFLSRGNKNKKSLLFSSAEYIKKIEQLESALEFKEIEFKKQMSALNDTGFVNEILLEINLEEIKEVYLGEYQGFEIHWTEALLKNQSEFYFLATVEDVGNAVDDGNVLASFVGIFNFETFRVQKLFKIIENEKAEGLAILKDKVFFCTDTDNPDQRSRLYCFDLSDLDC